MPHSIDWTFEELGRHEDITIECTIEFYEDGDERGDWLSIDVVRLKSIQFGDLTPIVPGDNCPLTLAAAEGWAKSLAEAREDDIIQTYCQQEADKDEAAEEYYYDLERRARYEL
ncbi:MAG: hypothetical protein NXI32_05045 [bacterium]|nr:hypothetical protein [bacterium]